MFVIRFSLKFQVLEGKVKEPGSTSSRDFFLDCSIYLILIGNMARLTLDSSQLQLIFTY
jgi:hypothetical protein